MRWKEGCKTLLTAAVMICAFSYSATGEERQYKLEAAFLYSFFNYITWPGMQNPHDLQKPVICVYGDDPIIPYLDYISDKMSEERTLVIRTITSAEATPGCQILFVRHRISPYMEQSLPNDTLVVFKPDDPLDRGGMIELSQDGERIGIRVDQLQLEQNGFQVSSRLLDLANRVR